MVLFEWIPKPKFAGAFSVTVTPSFLSSMLLYNLPDMLWFLSGIMFLRFVWFYDNKWQKIYVLCFYAVGLMIETSQLSENVLGTFDLLDVLFMGMGAFVEGLLYTNSVGRRLK
jgi:ABC-type branched-subunit amino acid transport system permease subunit